MKTIAPRDINKIFVSNGAEAAIAAATAANLDWVANKIRLGEWQSMRFEKKPAVTFVHRVVDKQGVVELVAVKDAENKLVQYVLRQMNGTEIVKTRPLGRIAMPKARDELRQNWMTLLGTLSTKN